MSPHDGSEAFCVCKYGFIGKSCEIQKQYSSIGKSEELKIWHENMQVPGMIDLFRKIEDSTESISKHVTEVNN